MVVTCHEGCHGVGDGVLDLLGLRGGADSLLLDEHLSEGNCLLGDSWWYDVRRRVGRDARVVGWPAHPSRSGDWLQWCSRRRRCLSRVDKDRWRSWLGLRGEKLYVPSGQRLWCCSGQMAQWNVERTWIGLNRLSGLQPWLQLGEWWFL